LHSWKNCTRRREAFLSVAVYLAFEEERHSAKALFSERNTRGRAALGEYDFFFVVYMERQKKTKKNRNGFPECMGCDTRRKRVSSPCAWAAVLGEEGFLPYEFIF
jgi:hypothetical protein